MQVSNSSRQMAAGLVSAYAKTPTTARHGQSSVDVAARDQLAAALDYCRDGDTLVVTKLDRPARSTAHLLEIVETLQGKGAALRVQDMSLDTGTANGRMMLTILGAMAQFEREIMLERQREGIEKARREGKYKGHKPTARAKAQEVLELRDKGGRRGRDRKAGRHRTRIRLLYPKRRSCRFTGHIVWLPDRGLTISRIGMYS